MSNFIDLRVFLRNFFKLNAYNGGPHLAYTYSFGSGFALLVIGAKLSSILLVILGIALFFAGPIYCKVSRKKVDFNDWRFRVVLAHQIVGAVVFLFLIFLFK